MKKKITKKKFSNFKRTIKDFIRDEDGFVSKETILKIGIGTIAALGVLGSVSNMYAGHASHAAHSNDLPVPAFVKQGDYCWRLGVGSHTSHPSHSNHDSY